VMKQEQLFSYIHRFIGEFLNEYVPLPTLSDYIVSPGLGDRSGIVGSLLLAEMALKDCEKTIGLH